MAANKRRRRNSAPNPAPITGLAGWACAVPTLSTFVHKMVGTLPPSLFQLRRTSRIAHPTIRRFAPRNDGGLIQTRLLAPRGAYARVVAGNFRPLKKRARGRPGAGWHPRSRVQEMRKDTHTSIQVSAETSGLPRAMVLRLMPCSPRRRIRLVTVVRELTTESAPGWADLSSRT
jgi:hypothetical protein